MQDTYVYMHIHVRSNIKEVWMGGRRREAEREELHVLANSAGLDLRE